MNELVFIHSDERRLLSFAQTHAVLVARQKRPGCLDALQANVIGSSGHVHPELGLVAVAILSADIDLLARHPQKLSVRRVLERPELGLVAVAILSADIDLLA